MSEKLTKSEIIEKFNQKIRTLRLPAVFVELPEKAKSFVTELEILDAYEVETIGEYSDEGVIFDYMFRVVADGEEREMGMVLNYGGTNDHSYYIVDDWDHVSIIEYLGLYSTGKSYQENSTIEKNIYNLLNLLDFRQLATEVYNAAVEVRTKEFGNLIGKTITSVTYDEGSRWYKATLDDGTEVLCGKEAGQVYKQEL